MTFIRFLALLTFSIIPILLATLPAKAVEDSGLKLLVIGDSLSDGYGVKRAEAYPQQLEDLLKAEGFKIEVVNAAESGAISASALPTLKFYYKRSKPDFVFIAIGGNDARAQKSIESIKDNLEKTILYAKKNNLEVVLAGQKIFTNLGKDYGKDFENIYSDLAKKHKIRFIPFLLEGVGGVKDLNQADGFHPNAKGHKKIAEHLLPFLKATLKQHSLQKVGS